MKLKNRKKGLNYDNVIEECVEQLNWNEERTKNAIEIGERQKWLEEIMFRGKLSYRLNIDNNANNEQIVVKDYVKNAVSQTEDLNINSYEILMNTVKNLSGDYEDFKKFVFSEISNIKSVKSPAKTDFMPTSDKEETLLVSVLRGQIRSLERQLDDKQRIIESLLNCQQNFVRGVSSVNVGQTNSCENTDITRDIKFKSTNNSNKAIKINVDANDHMGKANDERISIKSNNSVNINDHKGKANEERAVISNNNNTNCKKNIVIVGDSIINNIDAKGLGKNHNIKVRSYGGATTRDMVDHIKPSLRSKPDVIIIHAGTNDLTKEEKTTINLQNIVDDVKYSSPKTEVVISLATTRCDRNGMELKVKNLNENLEKFANNNKIKIIDNRNIGASSLSIKKLHLSTKGDAQLAKNFISFVNSNF